MPSDDEQDPASVHVDFYVRGADLDPDEVTTRIGTPPHRSGRRGELPLVGRQRRIRVGVPTHAIGRLRLEEDGVGIARGLPVEARLKASGAARCTDQDGDTVDQH